MFHHREWQKEQHKLKVCCLKVPHRRARPVRPCRVLHPCLRTSSADSNFLSQLQLTSEEHRQQVADEKELVEEGELARKLQQSARAPLEQQRQADVVVEKERQKKEKEVARKKKKADYMAAKRQDSEFRQRERDKRRYG